LVTWTILAVVDWCFDQKITQTLPRRWPITRARGTIAACIPAA
jgi:hypothetical protein